MDTHDLLDKYALRPAALRLWAYVHIRQITHAHVTTITYIHTYEYYCTLKINLDHVLMYLQDHFTPLYVASARGFNEVVKSLIAANADVNCICKVSCYIVT